MSIQSKLRHQNPTRPSLSAHISPEAPHTGQTRLRLTPPPRSARSATQALALGLVGLAASVAVAAELDESKLPPASTQIVDFNRDIRPILENACMRCHGAEKPKSKFRLDDREAALKGGSYGVQIEPGRGGQSRLIHMVARVDAELEMPPEGKGEPLTKEQVSLLRAWIDQGAHWGDDSASLGSSVSLTLSPAIQWVHVDGNGSKFREHAWMREGWAGGVSQFSLRDRLSKDTTLTAEGHFLGNQRDFDFKMSLDKRDVGFVRFGVDQYARYSSENGGFYEPYGIGAPTLDREMRLDLGRVWAEVGLTLPDWPTMTLGYENRSRRGNQALGNWGFFSADPAVDFNGRGILPVGQSIDESTHVVKFDLTHDLNGTWIDDSFRGEFYDLKTQRETSGWFSPGSGEREREQAEHFNGSNALRLERQLQDWLLLSGGYLYSSLDGEAGFTQEYFVPNDPTIPVFAGDFSNQILLKRTAHVMNANAQLGPWDGLSFSTGVQGDWSRQDGLGDAATRGGLPTRYDSNTKRSGFEERFDVRYTAIPFTVVHLETRFAQEQTDQFERSDTDTGAPPAEEFSFLRNTDAEADLKEFRGGFTISPWRAVSLQVSGKRSDKRNEYDHLTDLDFGATPGNAYPAFIQSRDLENDQLDLKLVTRPWRWLRATVGYQVNAMDFTTQTAAISVFDADPVTGDPIIRSAGGGSLLAGEYDAHTTSLNTVFTLIPNLYLSTTFSYTDSELRTASNIDDAIVPYAGDIYSVLASATYTLNAETSLRSSYSYSRADYGQDNAATGLPLGVAYDRHGILTGVTRQFHKNMTGSLQYGFFRYVEPTARGMNDYTAHAVFAVVNIALK